MKKQELIAQYAAASSTTPAQAKAALEFFTDTFKRVLIESGEVSIPGLGKLKLRTRNGRLGRNPKTGEEIQIKSKAVAKFSMSAELTRDLNPQP